MMKHSVAVISTVIVLAVSAFSAAAWAGEDGMSGESVVSTILTEDPDEGLLIIGRKPADEEGMAVGETLTDEENPAGNEKLSKEEEAAEDEKLSEEEESAEDEKLSEEEESAEDEKMSEEKDSAGNEKQSDGEKTRIYRILWTNKTGRGITGVQIKNIYAGAYPENMIPENEVFADGEKAVLYFDASGEEEKTEYNIRITFDDGEEKDMTSFPLKDMTEAELLLDENLLHAVYTSSASGEEMDTIGREKALRNEAERAREAAEEEAWDYDDEEDYSSGGNTGGANECIGEDALLW